MSACSSGLRNRSKAGVHLSLSGTATLTAGTCSGAITIALVDGNEESLTATKDLSAALTSSGSGSFYSDSSCTTAVSSVGLVKGAQSNQFHFKSTKAESLVLTADPSANVAAGTFSLEVLFAEAASLEFLTQPSETASATVVFSTQPEVRVLDSFGNLVTNATDEITVRPFSDAACTTAASGALSATTNPVTAASGVATFAGVKHSLNETVYLKATTTGLTSACSSAVVVGTGPVTKLIFTGSRAQAKDACKGLTLTSKDTNNVASNASADISITLSGESAGSFYSDSACSGTALSATTLAFGSSSAGLYYKNSTVEAVTLRAASDGLTAATLSVTVSHSVTQVAAGRQHVCVLANGGVSCWGNNTYGQLGNGTTTNSSTPVEVSGLASGSGVQAIVSGAYHSCAIVSGIVKCWGKNDSGQLGNNSTTSSSVPVAVDATALPSGVQAIAAGASHTCAIRNGGLKCWGYNTSSQLGDGGNSDLHVPTAVTGLTGGAGAASEVQAVAAGSSHTCALVNGAAMCWGLNSSGQLGDNTNNIAPTPVSVSGLTTGAQTAQMIVAGANHTCAVVDGAAKCWGLNTSGQLGDNSVDDSKVAVATKNLTSGVAAVSVAAFFSCALVGDGVMCWGNNGDGQLGDGTTTLRESPVSANYTIQGVIAAVGGSQHSCAVVNGAARCWGKNTYGQLGDGTQTDSTIPVTVSGLTSGVQSIAVGQYHTCAVVNGAAKCWGRNNSNQLGDGTATDSKTPVSVSNLSSGVLKIATGYSHSCALVGGAIKCWGLNSDGQLGDSTLSDRSSPVSAVTAGATYVSAGQAHTCAVVGYAAKCWGLNTSGQLGDTTTTSRSAAVSVSGLTSGVQFVVAGGSSTCAVVRGAAKCWGYNASGQLGDGTNTSNSSPQAVVGLTLDAVADVQNLAVGGSHVCAVVNGTLKCWGNNAYGQLGDGSTNSSNTPVLATGLTGVVTVSLGLDHTVSCVNGEVQSAGNNEFGQLGIGSLDPISSSAAVSVILLE